MKAPNCLGPFLVDNAHIVERSISAAGKSEDARSLGCVPCRLPSQTTISAPSPAHLGGASLHPPRTLSLTSSGDGLGLELDRESRIESVSDALEYRQGRRRAASLKAGNAGLGHAGQFGQVTLTPSPLLAQTTDLLPQFECELGCGVCGLNRRVARTRPSNPPKMCVPSLLLST